MNLQATIDELRAMKLTAMADNYLAQREDPGMPNLSFDERFALLISIEYNSRENARLKRLIHKAELNQPQANISEINDEDQMYMGASDNAVQGHLTGLVLGVGRVFDDVTIGLSVNGGGGYSETSGTVTEARDSSDFGGASLYAGWNHGPWNVYASVGYALSNHRVDIDLPRSMGFGSQEADIITSTFKLTTDC